MLQIAHRENRLTRTIFCGKIFFSKFRTIPVVCVILVLVNTMAHFKQSFMTNCNSGYHKDDIFGDGIEDGHQDVKAFLDHKYQLVKYTKPKERSLGSMDFVLSVDDDEVIERKLDRSFGGPRKRLPHVLAIGFAKCGTAALNFFLELNPFLVTSKSETNFLAVYERYTQGYNAYRALMPLSMPRQLTIDRGTFYALHPEMMSRVNAIREDMKFLLVVCDPITREISHHAHYLATVAAGGGKNISFEDKFFDGDNQIKSSQIIYKYDQLIAPWMQYITDKRLHIADGTRFKTHPVEEIQLVEDFLGVPRQVSYEHVMFNEKKGFFCRSIDGDEECLGQDKGRIHIHPSANHLSVMKTFQEPHVSNFFTMINRKFNWTHFQ